MFHQLFFNQQQLHQDRTKAFDIKASKGYWNSEKDKKLLQCVKMYGGKLSWNQLSKAFPGVKGKHIRQRYRNHLDPTLKQYAWTPQEDQILKRCYVKYSNSWELIAKHLPGRSSNQIKNRVKRRQFRELFQLPRPAVPKHRQQPTIAQEQRAMQLKKEQNLLAIQKQLVLQQKRQVVQDVTLPQSLLLLTEQQKRKKMTKQHKLQITSLHLIRTYLLIRENISKKQRSDFYLIFQKKTRRQIFAKIQDMHWTIDQLWPLVTNRSVRQSFDQEIAFFLYCLIKADNKFSNKIVHRILKCSENEDYLMKKVQYIINDIDNFIKLELKIMKEKELHEQFNRKDGNLKLNIEEDEGKERVRIAKLQHSEKREKNIGEEAVIIDGECAIPVSIVNKVKHIVMNHNESTINNSNQVKVLEGISAHKRVDIVKTQQYQSPQQLENHVQTFIQEDDPMPYNFDWMIMGKEVRISNHLNQQKLTKRPMFKLQYADNKTITKREAQCKENDVNKQQNKVDINNNIGCNSTNQSSIYNSFNELSIKAVSLADYNYQPDLDDFIIDQWKQPEMDQQQIEIEGKQDTSGINENSGQVISDPSNSTSPHSLNQRINQDIYNTEPFIIDVQQLDFEQLKNCGQYMESSQEETGGQICQKEYQQNQYDQTSHVNGLQSKNRLDLKSQSENYQQVHQGQDKSFKTNPSVILSSYYMKKIHSNNRSKYFKQQSIYDQDLSPMNTIKIQQSPLQQKSHYISEGKHQTWYARFRHKLLERLDNSAKIEQQ